MYYENVPGFFDFQDVYDEAVASAPEGATLIEVGTLFGRSALYMADRIKQSTKQLRFCVVDKWKEWDDVIFNPGTTYRADIDRHGSLFQAFAYHLEDSGLSEYVEVLRMDSVQASKCFDYGLHFVFIDADHSYTACLADVMAWHPRVGAWGTLAGHDYDWPTVKHAVDSYFSPRRVGAVGRSWRVRP